MRCFRILLPCLLICVASAGCGSQIKAKGRIVKGGEPFKPGEGEGVRIFFVPLDPPEGNTYDSYAGEFNNENGTFQIKGKDGNGLPPGKYRITMQLMKNKEDLFNGALMGPRSPFKCEIKSAADEVVVDLDQVKIPPPKVKREREG
jgi:ABC-type glycerol-3-phosphate transport system substrate-binding protein